MLLFLKITHYVTSKPNYACRRGISCRFPNPKQNKPGYKLLQPEDGKYFVLNADNKVIAFGPQLAPLWEYAVKKNAVKPIEAAEQAAISPIAKPAAKPIAKPITQPAAPKIEVKKAAPQKAGHAVQKKIEMKKPEPVRKKVVIAAPPLKKTGEKRRKRKLGKVMQMFGSNVVASMDQFVRSLGAVEPLETRKDGPMLRMAYIDPQWRFDRKHPSGIATKISSR